MNAFELLAISFAAISFIDAAAVELWLKPAWRAAGWELWKDRFRWYQLVVFGAWYVVAWQCGFDWKLLLAQAALHIAGLEDLLYCFWIPFFARVEESWKNQKTVRLLLWLFPLEWAWLGKHTGKWKWLSNYWLIMFGGDQVTLGGLLASILAMSCFVSAFLMFKSLRLYLLYLEGCI